MFSCLQWLELVEPLAEKNVQRIVLQNSLHSVDWVQYALLVKTCKNCYLKFLPMNPGNKPRSTSINIYIYDMSKYVKYVLQLEDAPDVSTVSSLTSV